MGMKSRKTPPATMTESAVDARLDDCRTAISTLSYTEDHVTPGIVDEIDDALTSLKRLRAASPLSVDRIDSLIDRFTSARTAVTATLDGAVDLQIALELLEADAESAFAPAEPAEPVTARDTLAKLKVEVIGGPNEAFRERIERGLVTAIQQGLVSPSQDKES